MYEVVLYGWLVKTSLGYGVINFDLCTQQSRSERHDVIVSYMYTHKSG